MSDIQINQSSGGQNFLGWFQAGKFDVFGQTFQATSNAVGAATFRLGVGLAYSEIVYRVLIKDLTTNTVIFTSATKSITPEFGQNLEYGDADGFAEFTTSLKNTPVVQGRNYAFLVEIVSGFAAIEAEVNNGNVYRSGSFVYGASANQLRSAGAADMVVKITEGVSNQAPVAAADVADVTQGGTATIAVLLNDTDPDAADTLSLKSVESNGLLGSVQVSGNTVQYSAGTAFDMLAAGEKADETFSYTVADRAGLTSSATVTVTVTGLNDAPRATDDQVVATAGTVAVLDLLANDSDRDRGDLIHISAVDTTSTRGNVILENGAYIYSPGAAFAYLPAGAVATDAFDYTVSDRAGLTDKGRVEVTVTGVNDPVTARNDSLLVRDGDGEVVVDVRANDTDPDVGDTLTVRSVEGTPGKGVVTLEGGTVKYQPGAAFVSLGAGTQSTDTFAYQVSDAAGLTSTATVTVTVEGRNDAIVAVTDQATVGEGGSVTLDLLANDLDPDLGDTKQIASVNVGGMQGTLQWNAAGTATYSPGAAFEHLGANATATDTYTYTVTDAAGTQSTTSVTLTVTGANDAPVATGDAVTVNENGSVIVNVLANDSDIDRGDTLTVLSVEGTPGKGTVTLENGVVKYQPGAAFVTLGAGMQGTDTFTYQVADAAGLTSTATVTVTVDGSNDAVVAVADQATVGEGASVTLNVLTNDTDPDLGDIKQIASVNLSGLQGALQWNAAGAVTYSPGAAFEHLGANATATDTFTYTVTDAASTHSTTSVTITVTGTNDAPVAANDAVTVNENGTVFVDVLANDTDIDRGDVLTLSAVGLTASGATVTIVNGKLVYEANADQFDLLKAGDSYSDTVSYTVRDTNGAIATATLTIKVQGVPDSTAVIGGNGASTLTGTSGDERIEGGNGNDTLRGLGGADTLNGGSGADTIEGGAGIDTLFGENGNDILDGGQGNDKLTGGNGNDVFVFRANGGRDVVLDFKPSADRLQFDSNVFANFAAAMANATQQGADVIIDCGPGMSVQLTGVLLNQLNANCFNFVAPGSV